VKPGKGAAFVRSKLRNLRTGNTLEKTFRAGEPLEQAAVSKRQCQYTYNEVWARTLVSWTLLPAGLGLVLDFSQQICCDGQVAAIVKSLLHREK
jgi:hypothetical protein